MRRETTNENHNRGANRRRNGHWPRVVRDENRQPSLRCREFTYGKLLKKYCRRRKTPAHLLGSRPFFRPNEDDRPNTIVSDQEVRQIRPPLRRPSPARVSGAREQPDQRRAGFP